MYQPLIGRKRRARQQKKRSQPQLKVKVKAKGNAAVKLLHKLGIAEMNSNA
jgi:hypothetical protein